jgi:hypothetical protein
MENSFVLNFVGESKTISHFTILFSFPTFCRHHHHHHHSYYYILIRPYFLFDLNDLTNTFFNIKIIHYLRTFSILLSRINLNKLQYFYDSTRISCYYLIRWLIHDDAARLSISYPLYRCCRSNFRLNNCFESPCVVYEKIIVYFSNDFGIE